MDQVEAIAKLLASTRLRQRFADTPQVVAMSLADNVEDMEFLLMLDPGQIEAQAKLLLNKRAREVARLIPHSFAGQHARFCGYAECYWPAGHRRHQRDALAFLYHLKNQGERICLREFWQLRLPLDNTRWFFDWGFIATGRGWRWALTCRLPFINLALTLG